MIAYTIHVYDADGFLVDDSNLQCALFTSLNNAVREAKFYLEKNGGIIDITEDGNQFDDPIFVWSSDSLE